MRTEDGYIIRKCLNGEPEAFGLLVDKYKASIYAFVYAKLRNFHDAEDVTQEVFIKAYRNLRTLRRWDSFLAWLYSIASDLCRRWVRSRLRRPDHDFTEDQDSATLKAHSMNSYREDMVYESLQEALDSLPEIYRQVLTLYYLGGMNSQEIARFLGASPTAIRKRLSRARAQLKEEMIGVMSKAFRGQRLQADFTFRIVEAAKRIKIQPTPRMTGLPWGLSLAAGILVTVLSLNPHMNISNPVSFPIGSPLPAKAKVMRTGELPVDILEVSQISFIASKQGDGDGGEFRSTDERGDSLLAPQASEVKLEPRDGAAGNRFGCSVSIHGDYAIVGAGGKDDEKGVAYIFKRDGNSWKEQEMLFAGDGGKEDWFGCAVDISDEFAVVGAPYDDDRGEDTGSVYIFRRTGESWVEQAKLNPHGQNIKWCVFGYSLAISGDYLVVGSSCEEWAGGAVYIFKRDGDAWDEQAKLKSSNWARFDRFGHYVSISGDYVIATATYHNNNTGSAYIFKREGDTWKEQAILTADDGMADDWFGATASISGDHAIVSTMAKGSKTGAAYVFVRDGASWKQQAKIVPDDLTIGDCFGSDVYISGDHAIVSAYFADGRKGAIYSFMRDGNSWVQLRRRVASDGLEGDMFGVELAFSDDYAIIGAHGADASGANSGATYIYRCREDLSFSGFPVETSGRSATTFGGEKNMTAMHDAVVPPHAEALQAVPREFRLLQNFPNPFNPETWLPYELASDATVMIWIYDVKGEPVRKLNPGRQEAGGYITKDKAAYWDGKDEAGKYVASGVYFYIIRAGSFIDTKKMAIAQ